MIVQGPRFEPAELYVGVRFNGDWHHPEWYVNVLPAVQLVLTPALHGWVRPVMKKLADGETTRRRLKFGARSYLAVCKFTGHFPWPWKIWEAAVRYEKAERLLAMRRSMTNVRFPPGPRPDNVRVFTPHGEA